MMSKISLTILLVAMVLIGGGIVTWAKLSAKPDRDDPFARMPKKLAHADHATLVRGPFADGPSVTRECLRCHTDAADHLMKTSHWTWLGDEVKVPGHDKPVRIGKANLINNFCIGVQPNIAHCAECHAGYGWVDASFDFNNKELVDCLVCHDTTGQYIKSNHEGGIPAKGVDLLAVAKGVGAPTRSNCGKCHFAGGGGDGVKHGDLDGSLAFPNERIDVHMGKLNFRCQDCHRTKDHRVSGRGMTVSVDHSNAINCSDCHSDQPHKQDRLNSHTKAIACQTCHMPKVAPDIATQMDWDWSTAGKDVPNADPKVYSKIRGSFVYAKNIIPQYRWYNGEAQRYLLGDKIDPTKVTHMNFPLGDINDSTAKIWPFKIHTGKQIYDTQSMSFIAPATSGEGGYWHDFDWVKAGQIGAKASGQTFSGKYDFAPTDMYWSLSHMVAPKNHALQCTDCHNEGGRMDWAALGYDGDPAFRGARVASGASSNKEGSR